MGKNGVPLRPHPVGVASFILKIQLCCACGNWIFKIRLEREKQLFIFFFQKNKVLCGLAIQAMQVVYPVKLEML
jgi:hypothetical protein